MKYEFGEIVSIPQGTLVKANFSNMIILGEIVGKASTGVEQLHIIKCTDGSLPSKNYPYNTFVAPLSLIETEEEIEVDDNEIEEDEEELDWVFNENGLPKGIYCLECTEDEELTYLCTYANGPEFQCRNCGNKFIW